MTLQSRFINQSFVRSLLATSLVFLSLGSQAQTSEQAAQESLAEARAALEQLDRLGETCLSDATDPEACASFQQALNGELLVSYINSCASARSWRDQFVTNRISAGNPRNPDADAGSSLQNLVAIEYWCGNDALSQASEYVIPAYSRVKAGQTPAGPSGSSLQYQLDSARQESLRDSERYRLLNDRASQQQRVRRQTLRQFQQLELELIRQQTNPGFRRLPQ